MNLLVDAGKRPRALLALENGLVLQGFSAGAEGEAFGEVVFNTSMTGYPEVISDPSYAGQIVTLTYPQIGNYGVCEADLQSDAPALKALIVHDMCYTPSNWQSTSDLPSWLKEHGVVAIEGVDTRTVTLAVRNAGTMRGAISTTDLDPESLLARVRESASISSHNYVAEVSSKNSYTLPATDEEDAPAAARHSIVLYDFGVKKSIVRGLQAVGCDVEVVPWNTSPEDVLAAAPDGVMLSNGPGDPTSVPELAAAARAFLGKVPLFGICLGNQAISLAAGAHIDKLPFGHHGGNEPVMNMLTNHVEITAQNHNYVPVFSSFGPLVPELSGGISEHPADGDLRFWCEKHIAPVVETKEYGRVRLTHINLNDGSLEGIQFLDCPAFSLQYHPEAAPGPRDALYAFRAFDALMRNEKDYLDCRCEGSK